MTAYNFNEHYHPSITPYIDTINFCYHINSWEYPIKHGHKDYWEFTIVLDGAMNNYVNHSKTTFPVGSVLVSTTKHSHFILNASMEPLRYITLLVREEYLIKTLTIFAPDVLKEILDGQTQFFLKKRTVNEIESILLNVQIFEPEVAERNDKFFRSAFLLLLSSLISAESAFQKTGKWVEKLNNVIRANDYLTMTVGDLCEKMGYSKTQLTVLFRQHLRTTPHEYLNHLKFEHASYLLLNSEFTIIQISERLGYANPAAFYTAFKKVYGVTPHEYKKQMKASTKEFHHKKN